MRPVSPSSAPGMFRGWRFALAVAVTFLAGSLAVPQAAADQSASTFIEVLGEKAIGELAPDGIGRDERERRFRSLLRANFDLERISRFVLGRYARQATREQLSEFRDLYEELMVLTYSELFAAYDGESFRVTREVGDPGDRYSLVISEVRLPGDGEVIVLQWQVLSEGGSHAVVDIRVEGVSMALAQREEFGAVLQRHGGDVSALIAEVREKVAALRRRQAGQ